jgi:hypothetical protein
MLFTAITAALWASFAVADFHLMSIFPDYITCPSGIYNSSCWCYALERGEQVSNTGSTDHSTVVMEDVCGQSTIALEWYRSNLTYMTIWDENRDYAGWCYYNYGFTGNCIIGTAVFAIYDDFTCITSICNEFQDWDDSDTTPPGQPASVDGALSNIPPQMASTSEPYQPVTTVDTNDRRSMPTDIPVAEE